MAKRAGVMTGFLIAMQLLFFQFTNHDYSPGLKTLVYLLLGIGIFFLIKQIKERENKKRIFRKGMIIGNLMSLFTGLTLVIINILIYSVSQDLAFSKYSIEPHKLTELLVVSGAIFFEILVFGLISTFISLQFLKEKARL